MEEKLTTDKDLFEIQVSYIYIYIFEYISE